LSKVPDDLRYTKDHEWVRVVYVELPKVGRAVKAGEVLGTVESVKAVSEIFAPLGGKVVEMNRALEDAPEVVNKDPYGQGWMVALEVADPNEAKGLMDAASYRKHIGE